MCIGRWGRCIYRISVLTSPGWKNKILHLFAPAMSPLSAMYYCILPARRFMYFPDLQTGWQTSDCATQIWDGLGQHRIPFIDHIYRKRPRLQRKLRFGGNSHVQKYEELSFPLDEILTRNAAVAIGNHMRCLEINRARQVKNIIEHASRLYWNTIFVILTSDKVDFRTH